MEKITVPRKNQLHEKKREKKERASTKSFLTLMTAMAKEHFVGTQSQS